MLGAVLAAATDFTDAELDLIAEVRRRVDKRL